LLDSFRVIIAAAGSGSRMNSDINKQYILLESWPVLKYSLDVFEAFASVAEIVIVASPREIEYCRQEIVERFGFQKVSKVIAGGKERQDSVWAGLQELAADTAYVAIHDGARPLLSPVLLANILRAAQEWGAAVPGILARDTLKKVDESSFVAETLNRSRIVNIQTPQIFKYSNLCEAYEKAYAEGFRGTDDAALFEKYVGKVKVVPGDHRNIKITTPDDLLIAQTFLTHGQ